MPRLLGGLIVRAAEPRHVIRPDDVVEAAAVSRQALDRFVGRDWSVPVGDLDWDVRRTIVHVADAVGWYAATLAAQSPEPLRVDFRAHDGASNAELLDVLGAGAATLACVASAVPPDARGYHEAGRADVSGFVAMGCDEILVHTWDAVRGCSGDFAAPRDLAERVLRWLFPEAPTGMAPWPTLLWANGRIALPGHARRSAEWTWHCAPLDEQDTTRPD